MNIEFKKHAWLLVLFLAIGIVFYIQTPAKHQTLSTPKYSIDALIQPTATTKSFVLKDVTLQKGILATHTQRSEHLNGINESLGSGACAFDYDNDGWIDLLLLNGSGTTHFFGKTQWWQSQSNSLTLYKNIQGSHFEDVTQESKLSSKAWTMGCNHADLDNDGNADLLITNFGNNELWQNNGDGTFSNITEYLPNQSNQWSTTASIADINNDGLLDIYINNYLDYQTNRLTYEASSAFETSLTKGFNPLLYDGQENQLFINQGNWQFIEQANIYGINNPQGRSLSSRWFDLNNDSFLDLVVANDQDTQNKVYLNLQGKRFEDVSTNSQFSLIDRNADFAIADFNNDANTQLFVSTGNKQYAQLYQTISNNNTLQFNEVSESKSLHQATTLNQTHWGNITADFNLDGWQDILTANGNISPNEDAGLIAKGQYNSLLINQSGHRFQAQNTRIAPETINTLPSRCVLQADFDNNGSPDAYISQNNGLGQLLENTLTDHHWIGFSVNGSKNSTFRSGVTVSIKTSAGIQQQTFGSHQNFLCAGDNRLVFGLGDKAEVNAVSIEWPHGKTHAIDGLAHNQYYQINDDKSITAIKPSAKQTYTSQIKPKHASHKLIVTNWIIQQEKYDFAKKELLLLTQHDDTQIRASTYQQTQLLPETLQLGFLANAIQDQSPDIRLAAVNAIKENENELLFRWLAKRLDDQDSSITCAAANNFAHVFDEEEAMVVRKYSILPQLTKGVIESTGEKQRCMIHALGKSEQYRALDPLIALINNTDIQTNLAAIQGLGLLREKKAIPFLETLVLSSHASAESMAAALSSIQQIDRRYDIVELINRSLQSNNSGKPIAAIFSLLNDENFRIQVNQTTQQKLQSLTHKWWQQYPNKDSDTETFYYVFNILDQHDDAQVQRALVNLSTLKNTPLKHQSYQKLLNASSEPNTSSILVQGLLNNSITTPITQTLINNHIDINKFEQAANSANLDKKTTLQVKLQLSHQLTNKQQLLLLKDAVSITQANPDFLNQVATQLIPLSEKFHRQCMEIYNHNNASKTFALMHLNACMKKDTFYQTIPSILEWGLKQTSGSTFQKAIEILIEQKGKWARDYIASLLSSGSMQQKQTLLTSLKTPLSPSVRKVVTHAFNTQSDPELLPYVVPFIEPNALSSLYIQLEQKLTSETQRDGNDMRHTIELAQALYKVNPEKVLNMFLEKTQN